MLLLGTHRGMLCKFNTAGNHGYMGTHSSVADTGAVLYCLQGTQVVVSVNSQDPYQYVLHILQTTPQPVAAAPAVAVTAAADAGAAADTAAGLIESEIAAVDADTLASSSSSSSVPNAEQATTSSTPAAPAPAAPPSGTPVVVEVSGLLFKHSSKSVANNYAVYVQVSVCPLIAL
jgi:hypothetical protein